MTLTSPRPESTPRVAASPRGLLARGLTALRRPVAHALTVLGAVALVLSPLPAAAAVDPAPDPLLRPGLTVSPAGNGVIGPGDALTVAVELRNDTALPSIPSEATISLGETALPDRDALRSWLAGDTAAASTTTIATVPFEAIAAGESRVERVSLAPDDPALTDRPAGVYPLLATTGGLVSTSAVVVPTTDAAPVPVGVVVPITADPLVTGLLSADRLETLTAPDGALTGQLQAVAGTAAILAVDPAILAAIRVLGTAAPDSAVDWLERLERLPNSRFALQYGDADIATLLRAGLSAPLVPRSLISYLDVANLAPADPTAEPAEPAEPATPSAAAEEPELPSVAELTEVPGARDGVFWPTAGTTDGEIVATLGELGTPAEPALTLVPSTAIAGAPPSARGRAGEADLLVYDTEVSAALREASRHDEAPARGAALAAAGAHLTFAAAAAGDAPLLVTLERSGESSSIGVRAAIAAVTQAPAVESVGLAAIDSAPPREMRLVDAAPDEERVTAASALLDDAEGLARFATILDEPALLTGRYRAEMLQLFGNGWLALPDEWAAAVDGHRAATAATMDAVGLLPPSTIQLLSPDADMPVWVRNDLPYPVNVVLYATPDDLRLDVQEQTPAIALPASNTRVDVPVRARIASGEVGVDLRLRSPTLEPIGARVAADVVLRADWEGIGVVAVSVLLGGFFVVGLIRTVRRRRREPHEGVADPDTTGEDTTARDTTPEDTATPNRRGETT